MNRRIRNSHHFNALLRTLPFRATFWAIFAMSLSFCGVALKLPPDVAHEEIMRSRPGDLETLVIMGINDFQGSLIPPKLKSLEADSSKAVAYQPGGASILATHIKLLRNEYGSNFMVLDAGDHFTGSVDADLLDGQPVTDFYNQVQIQSATLGISDFNLGLTSLSERLKSAVFPYVSSNVLGLPNTQPGVLIPAGNLSVGIVAATSPDLQRSLSKKDKSLIDIRDPFESVREESKRLRQKGADIVILLAHLQTECANHLVKGQEDIYGIWKPSSVQGVCDRQSELSELLHKLPKGSVDLVISSRSHRIVHHWINDTPVIQAGAGGLYYNIAYLSYDRKQRQLLPQLSRIEGPVAVCHQVFKNQGNCNGRSARPENGRGPLIDAQYRGHTINRDWFVERILAQSTAQISTLKGRQIGSTDRPVRHTLSRESEMGNLIADALRQKTQADFAFINPGSIRRGFNQGNITFEDLHKALPHNSKVSILQVNGIELRRILQIANNGARGFYSISGIQMEIDSPEARANWKDLNRDGITQHWEVDRLRKIRTEDGKRLADYKMYRVATVDYLAQGGDDLKWIMSQIPSSRIETHDSDSLRELVMEYLADLGQINQNQQPLVDPRRPRLIVKKSRQ